MLPLTTRSSLLHAPYHCRVLPRRDPSLPLDARNEHRHFLLVDLVVVPKTHPTLAFLLSPGGGSSGDRGVLVMDVPGRDGLVGGGVGKVG
jgi:hypothetical protein